ncbi:hypothetical protein IWQ62_004134 [Dispira parvispora]|uniref:DASH complex subunit DUO1 n=1 Tax=Dispira parvispora TaxID=1520584 RepID=A0A9W8AM69_9FUNG|nr:hypothetical protein IWQ62_004134 [Dispira parvispora]
MLGNREYQYTDTPPSASTDRGFEAAQSLFDTSPTRTLFHDLDTQPQDPSQHPYYEYDQDPSAALEFTREADLHKTNLSAAEDVAEESELTEGPLGEELVTLRKLNRIMATISSSLATVDANIQQFHSTITQTKDLIALWGDVFSETHQVQGLLMDTKWRGASHDRLILEERQREEERQRQLAIEEEARRAQEAANRAQAELHVRPPPASAPTRGRGSTVRGGITRGRGRGSTIKRPMPLKRSTSRSQFTR